MASSVAAICNIALSRIGHLQQVSNISTETTAEALACNAVYADTRDAVLMELPWKFATAHATVLSDEEAADHGLERGGWLEVTSLERAGWTYVYLLPDDCLFVRSIFGGARQPVASVRVPFDVETTELVRISYEGVSDPVDRFQAGEEVSTPPDEEEDPEIDGSAIVESSTDLCTTYPSQGVLLVTITEGDAGFFDHGDTITGGTSSATALVYLATEGPLRLMLTDKEEPEISYTRQVTNPAAFSAPFVDALAWRLAAELALSLAKKPQLGMAMRQAYESALAKAGAVNFLEEQESPPADAEAIRER